MKNPLAHLSSFHPEPYYLPSYYLTGILRKFKKETVVHYRMKSPYMFRRLIFISLVFSAVACSTQKKLNVTTTDVGDGWANNSVNTVVFRKNSLVTYKDVQYVAFYNPQQYLVIGKRTLGETTWQLKQTSYKGNVADAHNMISIMVDGNGYLHIAWDHHNNPLNYCRSISPGSLELTDKMKMTGNNEQRVSYPEFHKLAGGDLVFLYRDGQSGRGNLVVNRYDLNKQQWTQLHANLIDGEGQRNAYWQACVDTKGTIHLSWVWRESPDVASNHDMCYAKSIDGGMTWMTSDDKKYILPVTAATAEYAYRIPKKSELINQTSICADENGNPYIASYWREPDYVAPQYHLIYKKDNKWEVVNMRFRKTGFSLSGGGTKRIPISRPQIIAWKTKKSMAAALIFRDAERGNKVSAVIWNDITKSNLQIRDLTKDSVGSWEPTYDTELWKEKRILNLFVQKTEQVDGEGKADIPPQMIRVLEWKPG